LQEIEWSPGQESNLDLTLRRRVHDPLCYREMKHRPEQVTGLASGFAVEYTGRPLHHSAAKFAQQAGRAAAGRADAV
jgi:hypothetical protein